jgi:hypothetical protein
MDQKKRQHGQYFTRGNPFGNEAFQSWCKEIPGFDRQVLYEPFAGANHIPKSIRDLGVHNKWQSYDLAPSVENVCPDIKTIKQNTLAANFSLSKKSAQVVVTNPPYLAKNSATRRGLEYPDTQEPDLYLFALNKLLNEVPYVAAIIPESFLTQNKHHGRLYAIVSLKELLFEDTEHPVCLALFVPPEKALGGEFEVWSDHVKLGSWSSLKQKEAKAFGLNENSSSKTVSGEVRFNVKSGKLGLHACDNQLSPTIRFVRGETISEARIKVSSRAVTRIEVEGDETWEQSQCEAIVSKANDILGEYRRNTQDVFLTAFKGMRKDGGYRRRMDFKTAKSILEKSIQDLASSINK